MLTNMGNLAPGAGSLPTGNEAFFPAEAGITETLGTQPESQELEFGSLLGLDVLIDGGQQEPVVPLPLPLPLPVPMADATLPSLSLEEPGLALAGAEGSAESVESENTDESNAAFLSLLLMQQEALLQPVLVSPTLPSTTPEISTDLNELVLNSEAQSRSASQSSTLIEALGINRSAISRGLGMQLPLESSASSTPPVTAQVPDTGASLTAAPLLRPTQNAEMVASNSIVIPDSVSALKSEAAIVAIRQVAEEPKVSATPTLLKTVTDTVAAQSTKTTTGTAANTMTSAANTIATTASMAVNEAIHAEQSVKTQTVKLNTQQPESMQHQLRSALGERLQLQVDNRVQHATIRLDPPDMGKIEISLHFEAGKLQVHINASQNDVYRSLQQVSHELRQNLTEQNLVQVNVQVSSQQQDKPGRERPKNNNEIQDAQQIESHDGRSTRSDDSILMTV